MKSIIYKVTNKINGKSYIGFTTKTLIQRKCQHKKYCNKKKRKFYDAIKSYGWDNFEWEIIYESQDIQHCLTIMEPYFIREYNTFLNGYNMTMGGEGTIGSKFNNRKLSEETKKKISIGKTGKSLTDEHKLNISKGAKGIKKSKEFRDKMIGNKNAKHDVKVFCPHCKKSGSYVIMKRWHFEQCKNI